MKSFLYPSLFTLLFLAGIGPIAQASPDPDTILITAGEQTVTVADLEAAMDALDARQKQALRTDFENVENLLDELFLQRVLAAEALSRGLDQDAQLRRQMEQAVERILAQARLREIEQQLPRDTLESIAREHYQANRERFRQAEQVQVDHILVRVDDDRTAAEALTRIELAQQAIGAGRDFAEVAREFSEDARSAARGGSLGRISRGQTARPFEQAAFSLQPGETSAPVRTEFGFHLIRVNERLEARNRTFGEVREIIEQQMISQLFLQETQKYLQSVRDRDDTIVHWDALEALQEHLGAPASE